MLPKYFFGDRERLNENFSSKPLAPSVERRRDSARRGLFRRL